MNEPKSAVKKFSVSMPGKAYDTYKDKAAQAGLSISQFLYRAGSITTVEQAVMYPLKYAGNVSEESK